VTVTKAALKMAYEAGKHLPSVVWGPDATDEQRTPGVHHCPFDPRLQPEERKAWLEGLEDALGGDRYDPAVILKDIRDEIKGVDRVSS